ncbi:uncharacterized protein C2845_PM12G02810 [Panicum miliaceum]|uniref:G-patch domain-containing protein n=1 Tax=Panicum miliaceum TaxID=4540 RepID=A0A3L6QJC0_PANMI|nr:uncharacterized protein C2845_PM12G02810 [Panicum miliaceum]
MEQHLTTMKEAKISQELSRIHEQMEKNNVIALKSNLKEKAKTKNKNKGEKKEQGKGKKRHTGEAHLGVELNSSEESSSDDEGVATMVMEAHITKLSFFGNLTEDEDDFTPTCFMAKGAKNEIIRLTKLINENATSPKIGEFEKHTKSFGSDYMKKYGFVKGMGLGKNEQGR